MRINEQIQKINIEELIKMYTKSNYKCTEFSLQKKSKYIFTFKKYEVFLRLYVDKNIKVFIRMNTINCKDTAQYDFVTFNTLQIDNIDEYRKNIRAFYNNIVKEANFTEYCPEHHNSMIPDNATQEEIEAGWYTIYERRLLTPLNYNELDEFKKWLEKVTDKKYMSQQKLLGQ